ncbi:hypothetical protein CVT24_010247 [Panaeolus cyanescens]|uniref:Arabinan endo-1,5-alpha-L-arabinosidase n=1 Tax=Panaeolus cyanescens TaxID=181874 RepID=A0A409WMG4_9AGAR|nr:hypothetical protein CVT24_010247 [Panaeolus cyanescens]
MRFTTNLLAFLLAATVPLGISATVAPISRRQDLFPRAAPAPEKVTGNTTLHDPTMCKDDSGTYFLFSSGPGIQIRTSKDRVNWKALGKVWPNGSPWTQKFTPNGKLWAPECVYLDGQFLLYYAASTSGSRNSGIFLAKSKTGQPGSFTNEGLIISTTENDQYNAIDPKYSNISLWSTNSLFPDGNSWYLSFGSFWSGIKSMPINPSTGKPNSTNPKLTSLATRTDDNGAMEASAVFKHGNWYYLFTSWDRCCRGKDSTYNIRVGRSQSPTGVFVDKANTSLLSGGGSLVLGTHGNVHGPGGQDIIMDQGAPLLVYHYYTSTDGENATGHLGINKLDFSSGWPVRFAS